MTLVAFVDYREPKSLAVLGVIDDLLAEHPEELRHVHRPYFRQFDEVALRVAELGKAAWAEGRFWQLHQRLVAVEGTLDAARLDTLATGLELRLPADREASLLAIRQQLEGARRAGVTHSPVVFVNGRYWSGTFPTDGLRRLVSEELGKQAEPASTAK